MRLRYLLSVLIVLLPLAAFAAKPIENLIDVPVAAAPDGTPLTLAEVRKAIVAGARSKGWKPVDVDENTIKASIVVRDRHRAEVSIPYSTSAYSIVYVSSENLDYDEKKQKIHRNYNRWVANLSNSIQIQLPY